MSCLRQCSITRVFKPGLMIISAPESTAIFTCSGVVTVPASSVTLALPAAILLMAAGAASVRHRDLDHGQAARRERGRELCRRIGVANRDHRHQLVLTADFDGVQAGRGDLGRHYCVGSELIQASTAARPPLVSAISTAERRHLLHFANLAGGAQAHQVVNAALAGVLGQNALGLADVRLAIGAPVACPAAQLVMVLNLSDSPFGPGHWSHTVDR